MYKSIFDEIHNALLSEATPRYDVVETEEGVKVYLDMPGAEKSAIQVETKNGVLSIKAEKKPPEKRGSSRWFGTYSVSFRLGDSMDPESLAAQYTDGVLVLSLKSAKSSTARKIEVL